MRPGRPKENAGGRCGYIDRDGTPRVVVNRINPFSTPSMLAFYHCRRPLPLRQRSGYISLQQLQVEAVVLARRHLCLRCLRRLPAA